MIVLALALVVATVAVRSAQATADGPDYYAVSGVSPGNVLNIRAAPTASSTKIGAIPHDGRGIQNLGCRGGPTFAEWETMSAADRERAKRQRRCRVRYADVEGWVAGWFLTEDSPR